MHLIGVLRWAIELGRIDIHTEVAILYQYNALPREGHRDALYGIFAYMRKKLKSCIAFDPDDRTLMKMHLMLWRCGMIFTLT